MSSLVPMTGSTSSVGTDTPSARSSQPTAAERSPGVPHVAGYPGALDAPASALRIRSGTGSTGVPIDRSTGPSGCSPAFSRSGAIRSQVNAGSRLASVIPQSFRCIYSSGACGGSAATTGWSLPILPVLEAPPGEPRSSKKSTLTL